MTEPTETPQLTQKLFQPALQMARNAESLLSEGKYGQADGVVYVADTWLQFLLHGMCDPEADAAHEQSLANQTERPLLSKTIAHTRLGMNQVESNPRRAEAALKIAALYLKCAKHWEPAADDEKTHQEFEKLHGLIERQTDKARRAVTPTPSQET